MIMENKTLIDKLLEAAIIHCNIICGDVLTEGLNEDDLSDDEKIILVTEYLSNTL